MSLPGTPRLDDYLGALFIGIMVSTAIYGVTCLQYYLYFAYYSKRDSKYVKILVLVLLFIDTGHVVLLGICYYYYSVTHYADYGALAKPHWSLLVQVGVGTLLSLLVQCFYAYRIHRLGQVIIMPLIIVALALGQEVTGGILYMKEAFRRDKITAETTASIPYTTVALSCDVACDICIAFGTIYYLYKKSPTSLKASRAVGQLILYSMNTCLLTSFCALACLVVWLVTSQTSLVYAPFFFVMVRLYSCSLMTIMNSRENLLKKLQNSRSEPIFMSDMRPSSMSRGTLRVIVDTHSPATARDHEAAHSQNQSPMESPGYFQTTYWSETQAIDSADSAHNKSPTVL